MADKLTPERTAPDRGQTGRHALSRVLRPFRTPAYRRLAVALVFSVFAGGAWVVALVWEVIRIGGGPQQLSVVSTAGAIGVLVPALLGGVVADRVPQKQILLAVAAVEVASMAIMSALSLSDLTQLWHLAAASLVAGVGFAFYYPAYSAWLPALVPESDLLAVNGFEGMVRPTIGQVLGPAVAGALVGSFSSGAALGAAAAASAIGLLALTTVPLTPVRRDLSAASDAHPVVTAVRDMGEGFRYMWRTPWLLATLLFASLLILAIMGPVEVLVPFLIKDHLGGGPDDHALFLAAFGIGGALGSLAMAARPLPRRYLTSMNLMWGVGSLPLVLIGVADQMWVVVAASFVLGVMFSAPMVIWGTLLQRRVPPELLGRVASLDFFVSVALMPVSMALAGPVAEAIGLRNTFFIAGIAPGVFAIVAILWGRLPQDELAHPLRD